jgi:hypothetical protein
VNDTDRESVHARSLVSPYRGPVVRGGGFMGLIWRIAIAAGSLLALLMAGGAHFKFGGS